MSGTEGKNSGPAVAAEVQHPHITETAAVCVGSPTIAGTRIPVRVVVGYALKQDMLPEEFVRLYPSANLSQVYAALSYYHDHRDEIERNITENSRESVAALLSR